MSNPRFPLHAFLILSMVACSSQPDPVPPEAEITDSITDGQGIDKSSDSATILEEPSDETAVPTEQESATTDSGKDTGTGEITSDTVEYCPYSCQDNIGKNTCSALGEHWVRNAGYLCEKTAQICCQALGQPGGVQTSCDEQPALSCRNTCGTSMIQRTDYFCPDASKLCCEDPTGPTCTEMAGKCVTVLESCPKGYASSKLQCGSFVEKCCAPPLCPWTCTPYDGDNTCSTDLKNPTAIRNDQYTCPVKGEICCQPMNADEGIAAPCTGQSRMTCRETCESHEKTNENYYCPAASRSCCEDVRPKCIDDLGGQCVLPIVGCPKGMEMSTRGICLGPRTMDCCVDASPLNQCAQQGGTCVGLGTSCPLLTTMDLSAWCGNLSDICCKPIL